MSAFQIMEWLGGTTHNFSKIIDLRGESGQDPLPLPDVLTLENVFAEMQTAKERVQAGVFQARRLIEELSLCS